MNLTIKNIPEEVCQELKRAAAEHQRSLNGEIIQVLSGVAAEAERRREMRVSRPELERFVASLRPMASSVPLIREERRRR